MENRGPKLFGQPVAQVLDRSSSALVGILYEWDNGEFQIMWIKRERPPDRIIIE